jgi:hydroxymethylbilane synthase
VSALATGVLRLGTRRSELARTQSQQVADAIGARSGRPVELVEVVTHGDRSPAPLTSIGGTGVFVSALRDALLSGEVDLAVHSLKDLPTAPADGLVLAAVPAREDPRDVLVARDGLRLADLPPGARVGTGAPRRAAQLRALRRGLDVVPVRGNVGTRVAMVTSGRLDAVVLARAGLARIGRLDVVTDVLDPDVLLPAPGQGALAVECRAGDAAVLAACALLDDPAARAATTAERALLRALEAGCTAPVGALAGPDGPGPVDGERITLRAVVAAPDGSAVLGGVVEGPAADAAGLGRDLAARLLADGAAGLVAAVPDDSVSDEARPEEDVGAGTNRGAPHVDPGEPPGHRGRPATDPPDPPHPRRTEPATSTTGAPRPAGGAPTTRSARTTTATPGRRQERNT